MSNTAITYVAIVDDDERVCRSFGRLSRAAGIQPKHLHSAESFLANTRHPQFDGRRIPIVVITTHDDPQARAGIAALGYGCISEGPSGFRSA